MSQLHLKLESIAGGTVEAACHELCQVASRLGLITTCEFNGIETIARPGDAGRDLYAGYCRLIDLGHTKGFAIAVNADEYNKRQSTDTGGKS